MASDPAGVAHYVEASLMADTSRVIAKLFIPGEDLPFGRSRATAVVERVLALSEDEVAELLEGLIKNYGHRHHGYLELLSEHAAIVSSQSEHQANVSENRALLIGASFTAEYSVEGAALCNPSAVLDPDQSGLEQGQTRIAVSLRAIGEGHISSIGFATAIVGPGQTWTFEPRQVPIVAGSSSLATWRREHLRDVLQDHNQIDGLAHSVLSSLPETFLGPDLQSAIESLHPDLVRRVGGQATVELLRQLVASAYRVDFPADVTLSQRVVLPSAPEECNGMEDARFVRFTDADGRVDYRATYTAYDGTHIAPRLLVSDDLRTFHAHRLAGRAARNKGMALFPRLVGGRHLALCRSDGETTSLTSSEDGFSWGVPRVIHHPSLSWEILQVGNCGPPIETDEGWLVLTHGVGPMRAYAIGAILLDLEDPTKVIKRLLDPLIRPAEAERNGYVPNVVYSCGGVVVDDVLWLPFGIADARIGVSWIRIPELLDAME